MILIMYFLIRNINFFFPISFYIIKLKVHILLHLKKIKTFIKANQLSVDNINMENIETTLY